MVHHYHQNLTINTDGSSSVTRDGLFNPDQRLVNDTGAFQAMSDAVFYNAISWRITNSTTYSSNAASWIKTFFLDDATAMNPNRKFVTRLS